MASTHSDLHPETTKVNDQHHGNFDIEKMAGMQGGGGANLARQISVQLSPEQFERLYLQPGGTVAKGDLAKRFANPTPFGIASFLLAFTPFSTMLMGWHGSTTAGVVVIVGASYYVAGLGLVLSGLLEWVLGNTFPATVFITFGGYWAAFAFLFDPTKGISAAADAAQYNNGVALYLLWWGILVGIYLIASLRTNVVFVLLFAFLQITFDILIALYFRLANGNIAHAEMYLKSGGAFAFLTCLCGWYLLVVLVFGSTGIPISLPIGDLSNFLSGRKKTA